MPSDVFASKAEEYARYRADYPPAVIEWIARRAGLTLDSAVVELGSGTGLLSKHLLPRVRVLYAVEPSTDMRRLAESVLASDSRFRSVAGSAEGTGLPDACADVIVCGNAFHYFEPLQTRREARRILRSSFVATIVFHAAPDTPSAFMADYLEFVASVMPRELNDAHSTTRHDSQWPAFFGSADFEGVDLGETIHPLTWEALRGRFASTSVAPLERDPEHRAVYARLQNLFADHQSDGVVPFALKWSGVVGSVHRGGAA